ncbi:hypothetical protein LXL04_028386 [Taraxacum kok-saghyz]
MHGDSKGVSSINVFLFKNTLNLHLKARSIKSRNKHSTLTFIHIIIQELNFFRQPKVKPEEITAIINDFNEPGSLAPTGLYLGGAKYMVIQGEVGAVIRGKKGQNGGIKSQFQHKNVGKDTWVFLARNGENGKE